MDTLLSFYVVKGKGYAKGMYMGKEKKFKNISSASMKTFISNTGTMIYIKDLSFHYVDVSQAFVELVGLQSTQDLIGKTDFEIFKDQELAKRYRADDEKLLQEQKPLRNYVEPIPSEDGKARYCSTSKYIIKDENDIPIGMLGVSIDITKEYVAKKQYDKELKYLFDLPDDVCYAMLFDVNSWRIVDLQQRDGKKRMATQFKEIESVLEDLKNSIVEGPEIFSFLQSFSKEYLEEMFELGKRTLSFECLGKDDRMARWMLVNVRFLVDPENGHFSLLFIAHDIDKRKKLEMKLQEEMQRDALTNVLEKESLLRKIEDAMYSSDDEESVLWLIDIDDMKYINQDYGYLVGDEVLVHAANILRSSFPNCDCIGRYDRDTFLVFDTGRKELPALHTKAAQLTEDLCYHSIVKGKKLQTSASVAITRNRDAKKTLEALYSELNEAIYYAKKRGKKQYCIYEEARQFNRDTVYAKDYDVDIYRVIMERLVEYNYEYIALIDPETEIVTLSKAKSKEIYHPLEEGVPFCVQLETLVDHLIIARSKKACKQTISIPNVVEKLQETDKFATTFAIELPTGEIRHKEWSFLWLNERKTEIIITRRDITRMAEAEIDPLTGLYNRHAFFRYVRNRLQSEPNTSYMLARWDIDHFKSFNDAHGTDAGDALLADIGKRLNEAKNDNCVLGHIEADHFAILMPKDNDDLEIWNTTLSKAMKSNEFKYGLNFSVGVYNIDDLTLDVSLMCDRALLALRTIKDNYTNKVAVYDAKMRDTMLEEQLYLDEFNEAIKSEQFQVYFQPQINYEDGTLIGAEALIRWNHPEKGIIPPIKFIGLFERKGLISKLDEFVWEKSCQYISTWRKKKKALKDMSVSVNVSRVDMYMSDLCEKLERLVAKYKLPPSALRLEITESAYMDDSKNLIDTVMRLKEIGFTVEMDDFGAGYSSLNTLKDVPVDVLKLDMKFIENSPKKARGGNILASVLRMAHWLELPVIAEGVETKQQADYLKALGCTYMQGYHFFKPMPVDQFEDILFNKGVHSMQFYQDMDIREMDNLWDYSAIGARLFNSFIGGASVMEYYDGKAEVIRANDQFYKELTTTREDFLIKQMAMVQQIAPKDRKAFIAMMDRAVVSGDEEHCCVAYLPQQADATIWINHRVKVLATNANRYLIFVCVENISAQKEIEKELDWYKKEWKKQQKKK